MEIPVLKNIPFSESLGCLGPCTSKQTKNHLFLLFLPIFSQTSGRFAKMWTVSIRKYFLSSAVIFFFKTLLKSVGDLPEVKHEENTRERIHNSIHFEYDFLACESKKQFELFKEMRQDTNQSLIHKTTEEIIL